MRHEIETCPLCNVVIKLSDNLIGKVPRKPRNGLAVVIGYSYGGWGFRENRIKFGEEICVDCFEHAMQLSDSLINFLKNGVTSDQTEQLLLEKKS